MSWPTPTDIRDSDKKEVFGCFVVVLMAFCLLMTAYSSFSLYADLHQRNRARSVGSGQMQFVLMKHDTLTSRWGTKTRSSFGTNYIVTAPYWYWIRPPFFWLMGFLGACLAYVIFDRTTIGKTKSGQYYLIVFAFVIGVFPIGILSLSTEKRIWDGGYGIAPYEAPDGFMSKGFTGFESGSLPQKSRNSWTNE